MSHVANFKNNKTGNIYTVLHKGTDRTNSRDGLAVIVYSPVNNPLEVSVRDEQEFNEKFTVVYLNHTD